MKSDEIIGAVQGVTKKWTKQRKREEREASAKLNRRLAMTRGTHVSIRDAAFRIMEDAYNKASDNGSLPAHARQIMYAARGYIQRNADRPLGKDFDSYFTQTLLPDYIEWHGREHWNVVYDARGHFHEPHTEREVALGTLQVRDYLNGSREHRIIDPDFNITEKSYPTFGAEWRFGAILFVEKEGFMPLFRQVKLAERYDLAIMSTKGMSNTAARELVDYMGELPLLVLHDFDKAGFSIAGTLTRNTRRYMFRNKLNIIDIGLRLEDVEGLETEEIHTREKRSARSLNMRENGATEDEIEFLLDKRVELNAMTSNQLIAFVERKLEEHNISKVVPNDQTLADAYARMHRQNQIQEMINEMLEKPEEGAVQAPDDLRKRIEERLEKDPAEPWDRAVMAIVDESVDTE